MGLLCDEGGKPVSIEVFTGNTRDFDTFGSQIKKTVEVFGCKRVTFVGDRGMVKSGQIKELEEAGFHYITANVRLPKVLPQLGAKVVSRKNLSLHRQTH